LISKFLVGRKTSEVVENADESSFGEGQGKREVTLPGVIAIPTPGPNSRSAGTSGVNQ